MGQSWTAPEIERIEPSLIADERSSLEQWIDYHRATLLAKCAGLSEPQLKLRAVPPSGLSLLGLVRHMVEVERWWFRIYASQEDIDFPYDPDSIGLDFDEVDRADAAADLGAFEQECAAARDAMAGRSLDDIVRTKGERPRRDRDLRWIFVHMIEEYARHNGHADLLREAIDGRTGE